MPVDSARIHAPIEPPGSPPSPSSQRSRSHRRQRSKTVGTTTFVSTTVVPAPPSSADVLSSLISSLTVLSDTAREQIRSARELEPTLDESSLDALFPNTITTTTTTTTTTTSNSEHNPEFNLSTGRRPSLYDVSDGEEAEYPVVGYARGRVKEQSKRSSAKEKWANRGSGKNTPSSIGRSGSSQTLRRPPSGASSGIGIPSIERGRSASAQSRPISPSASTKSPLKLFFSTRMDDETNATSQRDLDSKSTRSFKTMRSKHSTRLSQDRTKDVQTPVSIPPFDEPLISQAEGDPLTDSKTYSPRSPAMYDDVNDDPVSSPQLSPPNSPGRQSGTRRRFSSGPTSTMRPVSPPVIRDEALEVAVSEELPDEGDSTLRRIRELQRAREKRQEEWRKESQQPEHRVKRPSTSRAKSADDGMLSTDRSGEQDAAAARAEHKNLPKIPTRLTVETVTTPTPTSTEDSPLLYTPTMISPSPSSASPLARKHKRSLSTGLRRSGSSKLRPSDDIRNVTDQVEAFLNAPRLTQRIRHPRTGRTIAFSEVGDPAGFAVFCCVGMGLTRYVTCFYDEIAKAQKLRLITPDRPGIGESSTFKDSTCTPLSWVDDIAVICQTLNIDKFSLLAHSAGSIYALATALKMPDRVRGRIHLLAPWIPPSQFTSNEAKAANLPMAHKLLSVLPAPFLKAANSRFLSATSASIEPRNGKGRKKDQSISTSYDSLLSEMTADMRPENLPSPGLFSTRHSSLSQNALTPSPTTPLHSYSNSIASPPASPSPSMMQRQLSISARRFRSPTPGELPVTLTPQAKRALFNSEFTHRTWALATANSNPAVDLLICFERRRPIGFKYTDVTRGIVIHHGRNDTRVPLANVRWLSGVMKRCELRVLDDEGHGLMASANVMSKVLGEIGKEWEEWDVIAKDQEKKRKETELETERIKEAERRRYIRQGH